MNLRRASLVELHWLALTLVAALVLRVCAVLAYGHTPESDELAYQSMARNLVEGKGIVDLAGNRAMYNVGYPLFVLAPLYDLFGYGLVAPRLVNCLFGVVTVFLCWGLAKEAGAGVTGRLAAAAFAAVYLPFSVYAVYLFKENLMTPLIVGVLWLTLRLIKFAAPMVAASIGALFGLLALTGNAALCLVAPVALLMSLASAHWCRLVLVLALAGGTGAVVVAPWLLRNLQAVGAPVLNTNGGFNLYLGNNPAANGMFVSISDTPRAASWPGLRRQGEVFASSVLREDAVAWIKANPAAFAALAIRKAGYFWSPPLHDGQGAPTAVERLVRGAWALEYIALCALALVSLCFGTLRTRALGLMWLSLLCYTGVHMLFYVAYRYREPIMPIVCVIAALAVERLLSARSMRDKLTADSPP